MQTGTSSYRMLWLAASSLLVLMACGAKSSSTSGPNGGPVPTSRITISLSVEAIDDGPAVVRANLNDGRSGGSSYRLDGGDYLRACVGADCRSMADNDSVLTPDYIARFDYQSSVDYVVSFNRLEARDALNSRVRLPPAFSIVTPVDHQPVTDGDTVMVSWSPSGAPALVSLRYSADCTTPSGSHTFSGSTLNNVSNSTGRGSFRIDEVMEGVRSVSPTVTRCSIEVTVSHELQGQIDAAFDNGTAVGIVSRVVELDYVAR